MSRFIWKGKPQKCSTKLIASFYLIIIPNKIFSKSFHIVNIETHHMTKSMRHKECMSTCSNCLINISFHQSQVLSSQLL